MGDTSTGFIRLMIIKPTPLQRQSDPWGKTWVSDEWLRMQTDRPSTHGWYDMVTKRLKELSKGKVRIIDDQAWWKAEDVLRVFKEPINESS